MKSVTVVGSGASGVHFALTLLRKGYRVRLLDVGRTPSAPPPLPDADLEGLKRGLDDPVRYFLGDDFGGVTLPDDRGEFYGIPPSKDHVFDVPGAPPVRTRGFQPMRSHARGGLAQAWTAGVYPWSEADLEDFPFGYRGLESRYAEVSRRIGICGAEDDLAPYLPVHEGLMPPLELDAHSRQLRRRYRSRKRRLADRLGVRMGLSRIATLSRDRDDRGACDRLGRCLWGCPRDSLYTPSMTVEECRRYEGFEYLPGTLVSHFEFDDDGRVRKVVARDVGEAGNGGGAAGDGGGRELPVETLALAAGTLSTTAIYLRSWWEVRGRELGLPGLMDNRQVLVPFVNLRRLGAPHDASAYQYHQLLLGVSPEEGHPYVHGQVTTLTTAQAHPVVQRFPVDTENGLFFFRNLRAALGVVNVNFHDDRRATNRISLRSRGQGAGPELLAEYEPSADEDARLDRGVGRIRRALRSLGCVAPRAMVHVRPMGASVHYAGTLPMTTEDGPHSATPECRIRGFRNLYVVDGATFPFLPAKNLTFTLMANAVRVAEEAF